MKSRLERRKIVDGVALYHFLFFIFWVKDSENKCGDDIIRRETFSFLRNVPFCISSISFKWGHGGCISNGVSMFSGCAGVCKHVSTLADASLCIFGISCQSNIFIDFGNQIS